GRGAGRAQGAVRGARGDRDDHAQLHRARPAQLRRRRAPARPRDAAHPRDPGRRGGARGRRVRRLPRVGRQLHHPRRRRGGGGRGVVPVPQPRGLRAPRHRPPARRGRVRGGAGAARLARRPGPLGRARRPRRGELRAGLQALLRGRLRRRRGLPRDRGGARGTQPPARRDPRRALLRHPQPGRPRHQLARPQADGRGDAGDRDPRGGGERARGPAHPRGEEDV
ncbi:MAG: ABC transporter, permease protein 1 (cluster 11, riboflavin/purine nucleoside/unknown), partial [uncultured Gemmatimonadaceae bacterium]